MLLLYAVCSFFFNDTATTEIYTLSLHDALPIYGAGAGARSRDSRGDPGVSALPIFGEQGAGSPAPCSPKMGKARSEEHTSELQSRQYLVCRLLLEKKKKKKKKNAEAH